MNSETVSVSEEAVTIHPPRKMCLAVFGTFGFIALGFFIAAILRISNTWQPAGPESPPLDWQDKTFLLVVPALILVVHRSWNEGLADKF